MSTIRLIKFADEGVLHEVADAEFLRTRKIGLEDVIDFAGITSTTPAFIEALFEGREPESLLELINGMEGQVAATLEAWLDRRPQIPGARSRRPASPVPPKPVPPPIPILNRPEGEAKRYTPSRLVSRLREQLTRYIEGAYPLNDPILIQARRILLDQASGGRLLAQEPFVETTPRYKTFAGGYQALELPSETNKLLERLSQTPSDHDPDRPLLFPGLYTHQAEAIRRFVAMERNLVVATGTGSGKTECFLIPMLGKLHDEAARRPKSFQHRAVRCLILYPMNALVNDQLTRLRLLFGSERLADTFRALTPGGRHPTFGMYTGRTLYPGPRDRDRDEERVRPYLEYYLKELPKQPGIHQALKRLGRYPAKDLTAFFGEDKAEHTVQKTGKNKGAPRTQHHWGERLLTGPRDRELLTRQEMVKDPETGEGDAPDILVTNYSMLEYMLMRPFERPIFDQTRSWLAEPGSELLLVLDEAHMYRGAKGAEVAFLLRRLFARLGVTEHPEKVRVISTSASLGSRPEALETARRFAADLTGKIPTDFDVVIGEREVPENAAPGGVDLARALAAVDLDALHSAGSAEALSAALVPVMKHMGISSTATHEDGLLRELHHALSEQPVIHHVLKTAAGNAMPLNQLADAVFPGAPDRRQATEALLTLGTLARTAPDEAGLLPTRLHMMFRGLSALHACINQRCSGRQAAPGHTASLGKLFVESRTHCDDCGSRVFELASCRDCGTPYVLAWAPDENLHGLDFLWGETEGDLIKVQLLPLEPRHTEDIEALVVQRTTGIVDHRHALPETEVCTLWVSLDAEGIRQPKFKRCPVCVPPGSRRESRIMDFRTKGEQPFTALIETQFSEQPPQKREPGLPNEGRKVLVFSDGRQKAAKLAPALETSHARDAFRQILSLAVKSLEDRGKPGRLSNLYAAALKVCSERGVNLYPEPDEIVFHQHLKQAGECTLEILLEFAANGALQPTAPYLASLFRELTDRFFSLQAIGMAMVTEEPLFNVLKDFPDVGLSRPESLILFRQWLRVQLERRCFFPIGATASRLGEEVYERPEGIRPGNLGDLLPKPFPQYLETLLGDTSRSAQVTRWFEGLEKKGFLQMINDQHYLQVSGLVLQLRIDARWLRCTSCNRLYPEALRDLCPECLGSLDPASSDPEFLEARSGYYRDQIRRALKGDSLEPFGLTTAEHSAQLAGIDDQEAFTKTEEYELRFQDIAIHNKPPIDVLSCTTTMEVGIDIGALTGVALRNVPPHVANYQQRAGRAGRRGRSIASVITYAHGGSHDAWFYQSPAKIISGDVRAPIVYVENQKVLERHINAFLIQTFFHETIPADPKSFRLLESFGTVETFLMEDEPCSYHQLSEWIHANEARLIADLRSWVPAWSHGIQAPIVIDETLQTAIPGLLKQLRETLPIDLYPRREELGIPERESLEKQIGENLLQTLIDRAILPRYAFPTDTVTFWVAKERDIRDQKYKRQYDYQPQRDLQIALTEYAPGRTLTIDKWRFTGAALYSPYQPDIRKTLQKARAYTACKKCGFMSLLPTAKTLMQCPSCGHEKLDKHPFITPPGFAPDINKERGIDRGGAVTYAGMTTPARLELGELESWDDVRYDGRLSVLARPQRLVMVNKGIGDRGFMICPLCGLAEPVVGPGFTRGKLSGKNAKSQTHLNPLEKGQPCPATAKGPFYLGHQFPTHVLLLRLKLEPPVVCDFSEQPGHTGRPARTALTSLAEALCLASTRTLQIDEGELAGNWRAVAGGNNTVDLYLYDLLPGGAGYTHQVKENLATVLQEAERLLSDCHCESSCYDCLRHYGNQFIHGSLDRFLARDLLRHVLHGTIPALSEDDQGKALRTMAELLHLKGVSNALSQPRMDGGQEVTIPMVVKPGPDETWIDVHHPLVDPESGCANVTFAAEPFMIPVVPLDAYTLLHDLPEAWRAMGHI